MSRKSICGFTALEMAIVMVIAGFLMAAAGEGYRVYLQGQRRASTYEKLEVIDASILGFFASRGRYPCPADPSLPLGDPNEGVENCTVAAAPGGCSGGLCRANGRTLTGAAAPETILIGTIPYKTLKIAQDTDTAGNALTDASGNVVTNSSIADASTGTVLDGWNRKIVYAVTEILTDDATYNNSLGAISVMTEAGTSLVMPVGSAHYVFFSAGENGMGAYRQDGTLHAACVAGSVDAENCDIDGDYISGLLAQSAGAAYYDDPFSFRSMTVTSLWQATDDPAINPPSIFNTNPRNVGIGTLAPLDKLTVAGGALQSFGTQSVKLCDSAKAGNSPLGKCFDVELLAGSGSICSRQSGDPANTIRVMTGIANNQVQCSGPLPLPAAIPPTMCTGGQYMVGFNLFGQIICATP